MKLNLSRKGFTLVEIMIVVVIIGLLAALAIPAFKKVRNNAIEKTIINDARQISSAANQYFTENATSTTTADLLVGQGRFLNAMSSGNILVGAANNTTVTQGALSGITFSTVEATDPNSVFSVNNANYDPSISSNAKIYATAAGAGVTQPGGYTASEKGLSFAVSSGQLVKKGAGFALNNLAY